MSEKASLLDDYQHFDINQPFHFMSLSDNGEIIESRQIAQNENGIDIEDRVLVGLQLLNKYMDLYDEDSWTEIVNRLEWK